MAPSERGWRRLLDPALAFLIIALFAYRRRYSWPGSRAAAFGWSIAILGLLTMLVGNVIEFWLGELLYLDVPGQFKPTDHLGWALFLAGLMILVWCVSNSYTRGTDSVSSRYDVDRDRVRGS